MPVRPPPSSRRRGTDPVNDPLSPGAAEVRLATAIGGTAVVMWSTLAVLTALSGQVPPFQLVAMAFSVATSLAVCKWIVRGEPILARFRWPASAWAVGVGGLFGYHFFYFLALRRAPAVEANLLNYLWPLLIVLFSALLPGHRLRWWHVVGALTGLVGTIVLIGGGGEASGGGDAGSHGFRREYILGYMSAIGAALTWAAYSLLSRRFAHVPTDAVGSFCAATALLAALAHLGFETTVWPRGGEWLAVLGMGLGPVGAAFFTWDYGVKHGDIRVLGAAAYATPLLSTLLLVAVGQARLTPSLAMACVLITGGALLAASEMLFRRS